MMRKGWKNNDVFFGEKQMNGRIAKRLRKVVKEVKIDSVKPFLSRPAAEIDGRYVYKKLKKEYTKGELKNANQQN